jgi:TraG P-loop domain/Pretoxin HINT domain
LLGFLKRNSKKKTQNPANTARDLDKKRLKKLKVKKEKSLVKKRVVPKTAQQTLPYLRIADDSIFEVVSGRYSRTYEFDDVNYQIAKQEDQEDLFLRYCSILNSFDINVDVQVTIMNNKINRTDFQDIILLKERNDSFDEFREEYNNMLLEKISQGQNEIKRVKMFTISLQAESVQDARNKFHSFDIDLAANFKQMGSKIKEQDSNERIRTMKDIFRGVDVTIPEFSINDYKRGSERGYIAPDYFEFKGDYFMYDDQFARCIFIRELPASLSDRLISDLTDTGLNMLLTINIAPVDPGTALKVVKRQLTSMEQNKLEAQKKAIRSGYSADIISHDLKHSLNEAEELLDDLRSKNQKMFLVNCVIMHMADSYEQLNQGTELLKSTARKYLVNIGVLKYQQEDALASVLPLGYSKLKIRRTLTTESTAILMPLHTQELIQPNGMYYGLNAVSRNLIMFNRTNLKNPNGFILGSPGCFTGDTEVRLADGQCVSFKKLVEEMADREIWVNSYDLKTQHFVPTQARDPRITKHVKELIKVHLSSGDVLQCTLDHKFLSLDGKYIEAQHLESGINLMPMHQVVRTEMITLDEPVPVYDLTVDEFFNFQLACGIVVHNSGKSFAAKREMVNILLNTNDDVIIIDPEREYTNIGLNFKGEIVDISAGSKNFINPMDMSKDYADDENPIILKSEFMLSLCDLLIGGNVGLTPNEKAIIDRCVQLTYYDYMQDFDESKIPTLREFHAQLLKQDEQEARNIALALELYTKGSLSIFSNKTNIDINNRLIIFDIKDLGKQLKTMGMLIVLDNVWNRITKNRAMGRRTWIYSDEFHLLFTNDYSANFYFELYKRARKWGGVPTGITQNVEDLLLSDLARRMLSNSDFIQMLNQAPADRAELAKLLNISDNQLSYVTNSEAGQGLLFVGNSIIPFVDSFPKNTKLYRMMTTKLDEQ